MSEATKRHPFCSPEGEWCEPRKVLDGFLSGSYRARLLPRFARMVTWNFLVHCPCPRSLEDGFGWLSDRHNDDMKRACQYLRAQADLVGKPGDMARQVKHYRDLFLGEWQQSHQNFGRQAMYIGEHMAGLTREETDNQADVMARLHQRSVLLRVFHDSMARDSQQACLNAATSVVGFTRLCQSQWYRRRQLDATSHVRAETQKVYEWADRMIVDLWGPNRPSLGMALGHRARALAIECENDPGCYPILADALEDVLASGVPGPARQVQQMIDHCRQEGPHFPGCWVTDFVLGRR